MFLWNLERSAELRQEHPTAHVMTSDLGSVGDVGRSLA
jgi:hypothetical protein